MLKVKEFLKDTKKANNIVDIVNLLEESDEKKCPPYILAVDHLFSTILKRGDLLVDDSLKITNRSAWEFHSQYCSWLKGCYEKCTRVLLEKMGSKRKVVAEQSLATLMKFISAEGKYPLEEINGEEYHFPVERLQEIISRILSSTDRTTIISQRYQEFVNYPDVLFHSWQLILKTMPDTSLLTEVLLLNMFDFMDKLLIGLADYKKNSNNKENIQLLCCNENLETSKFTFNVIQISGTINKIWERLMKRTYSISMHKKLLIHLIERAILHMRNPLFLTDFFMGSINIKGTISVLALHGILILVQKYNLEYPNIYQKLYSLFTIEIFHAKYKQRLFHLADIFLTSTHLQEQLVAAFAKRIARLALTSQTPDVRIMILLIGNIMLRHPSLKKLIHHPVGDEVACDPYIMSEEDPLQSRASESSLWELKLLQRHVNPVIANAAKFIDDNLPSVEWNLEPILDNTYQQMLEKELKRKSNEISLTFVRPSSVIKTGDDRVYKLWSLT